MRLHSRNENAILDPNFLYRRGRCGHSRNVVAYIKEVIMVAGDDRWHEVFERERGLCRYCSFDLLESFEHYYMAEVDHLLPRDFRERDELEYLVLACRACNSRLSRAHEQKLVTFEQRLKYLSRPDLSWPTRDKYEYYLRRRAGEWAAEPAEPVTRTSRRSTKAWFSVPSGCAAVVWTV